MKRSVHVQILGQKYTLRSDAPESYVATLAEVVDGKMRELQRGAKTAPHQSLAVLAALQLADELERERAGRRELRAKVRARSSALRDLVDHMTTRSAPEGTGP